MNESSRVLPFLRTSLAVVAVSSAALLARVAVAASEHLQPRLVLTALAAILSIAGAVAALRGRAWGLVLTSAAATAFAGVAIYGIAPPWFVAIAVVGLAPSVVAAPALWRFDRAASLVLALCAAGAGASAVVLAGPGIEGTIPIVLLVLVPLLVVALAIAAFFWATREQREGEVAAHARASELARAVGAPSPEVGSPELAWDRGGHRVSMNVHHGGLGATVRIPAPADLPLVVLPQRPLGRDAESYVGRTVLVARIEEGRDVIEVASIAPDAPSRDEAAVRKLVPADLPHRMARMGTAWIELDGATLSFTASIPDGPIDATSWTKAIDEAIELAVHMRAPA